MLPARGLLEAADAAVLRSDEARTDENIFYLLESPQTKESLFLIVKKNSKPVLLVSPLEIGNYTHRKDVIVKKLDEDMLRQELGKIKNKIGINFECQTAGQLQRLKKYTRAKPVDISGYFESARETKSQKEINKIKAACKITIEVLGRIETLAKRCRTEKQLAMKLEFEARNNGAEGIAFPVIVASGSNSAIPHYNTADRKISKGFLIVDFGVMKEGYCSDITRTFFTGSPTVYHKHMFATVYNAKQAATSQCFAGNSANKVHDAAETLIKKSFGQDMLHSVGHGLGMKVHDFPQSISPKSTFNLEENMCITVEPGYYKSGFGGVRIEDDVVIGKRKCKEMTRAEKQLISLKI